MVLRAAFAGRTPGSNSNTAARAREAVWVVLPALTLVVLLWFTWRAVTENAASESSPVSARSIAGQAIRAAWSA
jgi:hypothetical protein